MCLRHSAIRPYQKWHWAGDEIVHNPIIPASRKVPGTRLTGYDIDIRSFLSNENDAVIKNFLNDHQHALSMDQRLSFQIDHQGSFDERAKHVKSFMKSLRYLPSKSKRKFDSWLFPEETLAQEGGDCEDLSIFLAALLEASGISQYCIRIALGTIDNYSNPKSIHSFDHAWVMYQNERGAWEIFDPATMIKSTSKSKDTSAVDIEYHPHYVFNRTHLWKIRSNVAAINKHFVDYLYDRSFWKEFNPSFALGVHNSIFDEALKGMSPSDIGSVKNESFYMDINTLAYDPREHFDFAYIDDGWKKVEARLQSSSLTDFARAVHAIGDFYAHTLYGHFADKKPDGSLKIYDPASPIDPVRLSYDFTPFAPLPGCSMRTVNEASQFWKGKLISGQWWRWYTTFPSDLKRRSDFSTHRCLPDHDLLAVDSPSKSSSHRLYSDADYTVQFKLRKAAAIEHIAQAYKIWRKKP